MVLAEVHGAGQSRFLQRSVGRRGLPEVRREAGHGLRGGSREFEREAGRGRVDRLEVQLTVQCTGSA